MKKVFIVGSIIVITLAAIVAASSINNLMNFDERMLEDTEVQELLEDTNRVGFAILESCVDSNAPLLDLEGCKEEFMPNLVETCKDKYASTTELCNDSRIEEFFVTIDNRIERKKHDIASLEQKANDVHLEYLDLCQFVNSEPNLSQCKLGILDIVEFCKDKNLQDFPSCNDPRIDQILNKSPRQDSDIFEFANNEMLDFMNHCLTTKNEQSLKSCAETARQMIQMCNIDASVPACSDPRLLEIANYEITEQTQPSITQENDTSLTIQEKNLSHVPSITSQFGTLSLSTNKITIERDDAMLEISGNVTDYKKGIPLIFTIKKPDNELENLQTIVTSNGYFKTYWTVKSDFTEGNYSIEASYNDNKIGSLEFDVNGQSNAEVTEQQFTLDRECEQNRVCVLPGDHLTYSIETPNIVVYEDYDDVGRGTITYNFGKLVNQNDIELKLVFISEEEHEYAYSGLMDLTTGFLHDFPDDANRMPIGGIRNAPFMVENISSVSALSDNDREFAVYEDEHSTGWYNGQQPYRDAVFVKTDDYPQTDVRIDKETKIVIFSSITIYGGYIMLHATLIDTNIL